MCKNMTILKRFFEGFSIFLFLLSANFVFASNLLDGEIGDPTPPVSIFEQVIPWLISWLITTTGVFFVLNFGFFVLKQFKHSKYVRKG